MYYENVLFLIIFYVSIGGWGWIFTDHLTWIVINYLGYCYIKAIYQPVGNEYILGCRWAEKGQETRGSSIKGIKRLEGQEDQGLRGSRVKGMKVIKGQGDLGWLQVSNLNIFIYICLESYYYRTILDEMCAHAFHTQRSWGWVLVTG